MGQKQKCTILIVDDTEANLDILVDTLGEEHDICVAMDGESALELIRESPPDLILLDVMMPGMNGYEVCARLKAAPATVEIPVIFLTAMADVNDKRRGFELGAADYMTKPFDTVEVQARVRVHLSLLLARRELKQQNIHLEMKVKERTRELALTQSVIIEAMASLAESRDSDTADHVLRTKYYMHVLAQKILQHPHFTQYSQFIQPSEVSKSAILHDIGKVGVRDSILLKPGKLTPTEFEEVKKHTIYSHQILSKARKRLGGNSFLHLADDIAYNHHEKWDGSGYPRGLAGEDIPIAARLMAVADVYDAIISKRIYKDAMSHEEAVAFIRSKRGSHFDPDVVDAFVSAHHDFKHITEKFTPGISLDEDDIYFEVSQ